MLTRINNTINGSPRYALHYTELADNYDDALKIAKNYNGRKYHKKSFGGGIVFSGIYDTEKLLKFIENNKTN
ncbi:MAG: hypothetical protein ACTSXL_02495 [Alphaproteobacteria bacterium]